MPAHVSVSHLDKFFYGPQGVTTALSNVDLEIDAGTFVTLLGPSGCGKSTLLRIIAGLERQDNGICQVNRTTSRDRPAMVFQGGGLFPWRNVLRNVTFPMERDRFPKREQLDKARYWLERVGLSGFEKSYPHQLSGGMRQRVAIARAFASGKSLLLMDEPLGALDAQTRALMQEQLLDLWQEHQKTVVFVTHSIDEAILLGDRIILMSARPGRVRDDIKVPFDRPRSAELASTPKFADLKNQLWHGLREEVADSLTSEVAS